MILLGLCLGIAGFLAHTAIKACLDLAIGIGYIVNFFPWAFLSLILGIHSFINVVVSFILMIITIIIGAIAVIIASIPGLNVVVFACGQWAWTIFGTIFTLIYLLYDAYIYATGFILWFIMTFVIVAGSAFNDFLLHCRSIIAPVSVVPALFSRFSLITVSPLIFFQDLILIIQICLADLSIMPSLASPMGLGFFMVATNHGLIAIVGIVDIIFFGIWNIFIVFASYVLSIITFLVSIPLDLVLSAVVWIGLFFLLGVCGTI